MGKNRGPAGLYPPRGHPIRYWFPRLAYQVVQCEEYVQYEAEYWNRPYW
jgi:hypothetical protein